MKDNHVIAIIVIIAVLACFLIVPLSQIWAINTLFGTSIAYNLTNYWAVVVLNMCMRLWLTPKIEKK